MHIVIDICLMMMMICLMMHWQPIRSAFFMEDHAFALLFFGITAICHSLITSDNWCDYCPSRITPEFARQENRWKKYPVDQLSMQLFSRSTSRSCTLLPVHRYSWLINVNYTSYGNDDFITTMFEHVVYEDYLRISLLGYLTLRQNNFYFWNINTLSNSLYTNHHIRLKIL